MKKLLIVLLIVFCLGNLAVAQAVSNSRWDYAATTTTTTQGNLIPLMVIPGAAVSFYTGCTTLPCTTKASVYIAQSSSIACPATAQIVLQLTSTCSSIADRQGNFGGWFQPGVYQYVITLPGNGPGQRIYGPYNFTISPINGGGDCINCVGSLPVYKQNTIIGAPRDPYGVIAITATPQDGIGCANSGMGLPDDQPCFDQELIFLQGLGYDNSVRQLTIPKMRFPYNFAATGYLIELPRDFGDYHSSAGHLSAATIQAYFVNGGLDHCTVLGGTKYAPNTKIPVLFIDPNKIGTGATAYSQTDANGTPTNCITTSAGMRYPDVGTSASLFDLGGDNAAGTINLVNGVIVGPGTVTNGGSGYASFGPPTQVPGLVLNGPNAALPVLTVLTSNASVSSITVTNGGSNLTYLGSPNASNIPVIFGDTCGGAQCHNQDLEPPTFRACSVALRRGVRLVGQFNPEIDSPWTHTGTVALNVPVPFCDPWGDQATPDSQEGSSVPLEMRDLTISGIYGVWFSGPLSGGHFYNVSWFGKAPTHAPGMPKLSGGVVYSNSVFEFNRFITQSGPVCGAPWSSRNPNAGGGGNLGGIQYSHPNMASSRVIWGDCNGITVKNSTASITSVADTAYDLDEEVNYFKTQNGPGTFPITPVLNLTNGTGSCLITQTVVNRATDGGYGYVNSTQPNQFAFPWYPCYTGVAGSFLPIRHRYWNTFQSDDSSPGIVLDDVSVSGGFRPILSGLAVSANIRSVTQTVGGTMVSDPYLPGGQLQHMFSMYSYGSLPSPKFDIFRQSGSVALTNYDANNPISMLFSGLQNRSSIEIRSSSILPDQTSINQWIGQSNTQGSWLFQISGNGAAPGWGGPLDPDGHFYAICPNILNCGGVQNASPLLGGNRAGSWGTRSANLTTGRSFFSQTAGGNDVLFSEVTGDTTAKGNLISNGLNIKTATLAGGPSVVASLSGGTLADSTNYCYKTRSNTFFGHTAPSSMACVTTGISGNQNSITIAFSSFPGYTGFDIFGRTSGSFLKMNSSTIAPTGTTISFVDNGSITPSGAITADDTSYGIQTPSGPGLKASCTGGAFTVDAGVVTGCSGSGTTIDYYWTATSCVVANTQPNSCDGTTTLPGSMPDASYQVFCSTNDITTPTNGRTVCSIRNGGVLPTSGSLPYQTIQVIQGSPGGSQPTLYFHAHHN